MEKRAGEWICICFGRGKNSGDVKAGKDLAAHQEQTLKQLNLGAKPFQACSARKEGIGGIPVPGSGKKHMDLALEEPQKSRAGA